MKHKITKKLHPIHLLCYFVRGVRLVRGGQKFVIYPHSSSPLHQNLLFTISIHSTTQNWIFTFCIRAYDLAWHKALEFHIFFSQLQAWNKKKKNIKVSWRTWPSRCKKSSNSLNLSVNSNRNESMHHGSWSRMMLEFPRFGGENPST